MEITGLIGQKILFSGRDLYRISSVSWGGFTGQFDEVNDAIYATVPETAAWGFVQIGSESRGITGTSSERFVPFPVIDGFTPLSGVPGDVVTITGKAFSGVRQVDFNNLSGNFTGTSNSGISVSVPTGNTYSKITLYGQSGVQTRTTSDFIPLAQITGISPTSVNTGQTLDILGNNFLTNIMYNTSGNYYLVGFNGNTGQFERINATRLQGTVPVTATTGPVTIFRDLTYAYFSNVSGVILPSQPVVTRMYPDSGKVGNSILVEGSNFDSVTGVIITGGNFNNNLYGSGGTIISSLCNCVYFNIPGHLTEGKYSVIIAASGGRGTGLSGLHVLETPTITSLTATTGTSGDIVRITGTNLYSLTQVCFNSAANPACTITGHASDNTYIDFIVPSHALQTNTVIVDNSAGIVNTGFNLYGLPAISGFSPMTGGYFQNVSITGSGLLSTYLLMFDTFKLSGSNITINNDTRIQFRIPSGATDSNISIRTSGGAIISSGLFLVYPPAITISGFSPLTGVEGTGLYISGANIRTATGIRFTGINGNTITINSDDFTTTTTGILVTTIPYGARNGQFYVLNRSASTQSTDNLSVTLPPSLSGINPLSGIFRSTLTISGQNFGSGITQFYFLGITGDLVSGYDTSITNSGLATTRVPREIKRSNIYVSGLGFTIDRNVNSPYITFTPLPTISGFNTGILYTGGSVLVLTGINAYEIYLDKIVFSGGQEGARNMITRSGDVQINTSQLTGNTTGFTIISGSLNSNSAGGVKVALVSQYYAGNISGLPSDTFHNDVFTFNQTAPDASGINILSGGYNTPITFTGRFFSFISQVLFQDIDDVFPYQTGTNLMIYGDDGFRVTPPSGAAFGDTRCIFYLLGSYAGAGWTGVFDYMYIPNITEINPTVRTTGQAFTISGDHLRYTNNVYLTDIFSNRTPVTYNTIKIGTGYQVTGNIPNDVRFNDNDYFVVASNVNGSHTGSAIRIKSQRTLDDEDDVERKIMGLGFKW